MRIAAFLSRLRPIGTRKGHERGAERRTADGPLVSRCWKVLLLRPPRRLVSHVFLWGQCQVSPKRFFLPSPVVETPSQANQRRTNRDAPVEGPEFVGPLFIRQVTDECEYLDQDETPHRHCQESTGKSLLITQEEERQLLLGSTSDELAGIFGRSGVNTLGTAAAGTIAVEHVFKAASGVRGSAFLDPDLLVINPTSVSENQEDGISSRALWWTPTTR